MLGARLLGCRLDMVSEQATGAGDGAVRGAPLAVTAELVFPSLANHHGTLFGGAALALMDRAAFIAASRVLRRVAVTAGAREVRFQRPVPVGSIAEAQAGLLAVDGRKVRIWVELYLEALPSCERALAATGEFICVAVDAFEARDDSAEGPAMAAAPDAAQSAAAAPPAVPQPMQDDET